MEEGGYIWTAHVLGHFASIIFAVQYCPQALLNWRRKSVKGFSGSSIIVKHVGACFLAINAYLQEESAPVVSYGLFNIIQHSIFLYQLASYDSGIKSSKYWLWLAFPIVPFGLGIYFPNLLPLTNFVNPACQIISHIPQLILCFQQRSTAGLSLLTQHFNLIGGIAGLIFCYFVPPHSFVTYLLYLNS